ncbi:YqgE/AlgH family protein [Pyxidicoccus xibeiensis]|uniref:YqgE/AlgH family protein n=1 Tax=Pyxidicoccus xibeiensis TaxID=2906759 RepID=UPI0020A75731|nr:YqgE/AlgH family protein [Pyxidicoccus xibeiensis]MCP3141453.1 YqgE/AlgH family protein [Pyxidicoccus xibeiensis]
MKSFAPRHPVALLLASALVVLVVLPRLIDTLKQGDAAPLAPGVLLVARPGGVGDTFHQTVVLLLEAGGARTWGLVLNRARLPGGGPLPSGVDRWGGPVHPEHRLTVCPSDGAPGRAHRVLDGLSWYEGPREGEAAGGPALTFAGVAAWAPGQLEEELARGAWWVVEAEARTVFTAPDLLWAEHAARRL